MEFLRSLEKSGIGSWVRESEWGYAIVLCAHAVGMAIVVGILFVINVRVLGYARALPLGQLKRLAGLAWAGFVINAVSGVMLIFGNARRLFETTALQIKLVLLVLGGMLVWYLWRTLNAEPQSLEPDATPSQRARMIAIASLVVWLAVIVAGRTIGYTVNFEPLP